MSHHFCRSTFNMTWHDICPSIWEPSVTSGSNISPFWEKKSIRSYIFSGKPFLLERIAPKMESVTKPKQTHIKTSFGRIQIENSQRAERVNNGSEEKKRLCSSGWECVEGSAVKLTMHWENSCAAGLSGSITTALLQAAPTRTHTHTCIYAHIIIYAHIQIHTVLINMQKLWQLHQWFCITAFWRGFLCQVKLIKHIRIC